MTAEVGRGVGLGSHPINLAFRFVLEIAALVSLAAWGWSSSDGWTRFLFAIAAPLLAGAIWATFAVAGDPSRSGAAPVPVPGILRLGIEAGIFSAACWALYDIDARGVALTLAIATVLHYVVSYDRVRWLLSR